MTAACALPMQLSPAVAARVLQTTLDQPFADLVQQRRFLSLMGWRGTSTDLTAGHSKPASKLWLSSAQSGGRLLYFDVAGRSSPSR